MLEKYNNEIKKIIKLFVMLFATYFTVTNIPDIQIDNCALLKLIIIIGIVFIILENYYPTVTIAIAN